MSNREHVPASDRLHVVTGGPGSGKTTLIDALARAGVRTSAEVGRQIIRDQLATGGTALPWEDRSAFADAIARREVQAHGAALAWGGTVVLDRGVPDVIGFLRLSRLPVPGPIDAAARACRYHRRVFIAPFWSAIYTADEERRQSADEAEETHAMMLATYRDYGYNPVELPRMPVADRAAFVLEQLEEEPGP